VYAYGENDGRQPDVVGVVDTRTNAMQVEQLPAAVQSLWGFALNPNGRYLYVANSPLAPGGGGIVLVDTANWRSRTVVLHADPNGMAVSPDGRRLYVLEQTEIAVLG
jgi:DNA-binding beta-propeller fold protein YncE